LILGSVFALFALRTYKKKKVIEPETEKTPPDLKDYDFKREPGEWNCNLYQSLVNDKILIREVRVFDSKKEEKDKLIFASSLPFNFRKEDRIAFKIVVSELTDVTIINSHELMVAKSPAADFSSLKKEILTHLFIYLNRKYSWMKKPMCISLYYTEANELNCHLQEKTENHNKLGILLGNTSGVTDWLNMTTQMEAKDTYQFDIAKEDYVKWPNLLPKIQEVFRQYFTGGVEFIGPN